MKASRALALTVGLVLGLHLTAIAQPTPHGPTPAPSGSSSPSSPPPAGSAAPSAAPAASGASSAGPAAPRAKEGAKEGGDEGPNPANKAEAQVHFERGLKLFIDGAWTAALAEFLQSRELFPTRNATINAAVCLRKLNRFDEALDMYEALLREFSNLPADKKAAAQKEIMELRGLVGTIDITGAEPGASIVVDGKARQDFPLVDPLRVSAGAHGVRLFKDGFEAFESRVDVAGGQTVHVVAKMPALTASGRLRVVEKSGKPYDVVVDGAVAGVTPWEGSVAVGHHVVLLRGDEDLGTQPAAAPVRTGEVTSLTLAAEHLEASILVDVTPAGARISVDSVPVGRGIWDGRLRAGAHVVEVEGDGFFPIRQDARLERGDRKELHLAMQRDAEAAKWRTPSKILVDASGGLAIAPSFGGDVAGGCADACSKTIGLGALAMLHAGYEFGATRFALGLSGGFLQASQDVSDRSAKLAPNGLSADAGMATDQLTLRGFLVGLHASKRFGDRFPIRLRLGAGALIGTAKSVRDGDFQTRAGTSYTAPELGSSGSAAFVYVDPEATVGVRLGDHLELGAGVSSLVLVAASKPRWGGDQNPEVVVPGDGLSHYPGESLVGDLMVIVVPTLGAHYVF